MKAKTLAFAVFLQLSLGIAACQHVVRLPNAKTDVVQVTKSPEVDYIFQQGDFNMSNLTLMLAVDSISISESRSRIRIFVNLPDADHKTLVSDRSYLGGISLSLLATGPSVYLFDFSDFLMRYSLEEKKDLVRGKITLKFVPIPFDSTKTITRFRIQISECLLTVKN